MAYSIYETIRNSRFENCIILSYGVNIRFYESIIWMHLYRKGCHNNILLADGDQYHKYLEDEVNIISHLGTGYTIYPIYKLSTFHPKIIFLSTKSAGKLIIGSANTTVSAFSRNKEIVNEFNYKVDKDEEYLYLFHDCWRYIKRICEDAPPIINYQIEQLARTSPWLHSEGMRKDDISFVSFPNPNKNNDDKIIDSISPIIGTSSVKEICILSPFLDSDLRIVKKFQDHFNIKKIKIITNPNIVLNPASKPILEKSVPLYKFNSSLLDSSNSILHGKAMYFKTNEGDYLLCGSMNFTSRAFGIDSKNSNYEAGLLYKIKDTNYFDGLRLSEMITQTNLIEIKDIRFETKTKEKNKKEEKYIYIWVESLGTNIELYLSESLFEGIDFLKLTFFAPSEKMLKEIKVHSFEVEENLMVIADIDKEIINKSQTLKLSINYKNGQIIKSTNTIINKINAIREATVTSKISKLISALSDRTELIGNDYDLLARILHDYLFDNINKEQGQVAQKITKSKYNEEKNAEIIEGELDREDVISLEPSQRNKLRKYSYFDSSISIIKELFIRTFLKTTTITNDYKTQIDKEFEEGKHETILLKEEELEEVYEDEDLTEKQDTEKISDEKKSIASDQSKQISSRYKKNLLKKYKDHLSELEQSPELIELENEFVRHFAVFLMSTKHLESGLYLKKKEEDFEIEGFITFTTSLLRNYIGKTLTDYINKKYYLYEKGFYFGLFSIFIMSYLIDKKLEKIISERLFCYDKRREDFLWIMNRLLLLSFISRFSKNDMKQVLAILKNNYNNVMFSMGKTIRSISFISIENFVQEAQKVNFELSLNDSLWNCEEFDLISPDQLNTGDLVFLKNQGPCFIRKIDIKSNTLDVFAGLKPDGSVLKYNLSLNERIFLKLNVKEVSKKYFRELLFPKKSYWHYEN